MARMTISADPFFASSMARLDMQDLYMQEPYISRLDARRTEKVG
jgi:hypothetical protein